MANSNFQKLRVYQLSEKLSDQLWQIMIRWPRFAQQTVGLQLVRAADSVGANLAEGTGRGSYLDNRRFILMSRGSLYEVQHWLRRAYRRRLLRPEEIQELQETMNNLLPQLNAYLNSVARQAQGGKQ